MINKMYSYVDKVSIFSTLKTAILRIIFHRTNVLNHAKCGRQLLIGCVNDKFTKTS